MLYCKIFAQAAVGIKQISAGEELIIYNVMYCATYYYSEIIFSHLEIPVLRVHIYPLY